MVMLVMLVILVMLVMQVMMVMLVMMVIQVMLVVYTDIGGNIDVNFLYFTYPVILVSWLLILAWMELLILWA